MKTYLSITKAILADQLGIEESDIFLESNLRDLGADSLDDIEMIMEFEEEFQIDISDDAADKIKKVGDIVDYLEETLGPYPPQTPEPPRTIEPPKAYRWKVRNEATGQTCTYTAQYNVAVTADHVRASPKVREWAGGDPVVVTLYSELDPEPEIQTHQHDEN